MIATVLRSWRLLSRRQKTVLTLLTAARVASNGLDLLGIFLVGWVGTLAVNPAGKAPLFGFETEDPERLLLALLLLASLVFVLKTAAGIALFRLTSRYLAGVETNFSVDVSKQVFSGPTAAFWSLSQPETEWMILRSTNVAFSKVLGSAISFFAEASLAFVVFALLFITDWRLALAVTFYFSLILYFFQFFSQKIVQRSGRDTARGSVEVHAAITSLTDAFKELTVLGKTQFFLDQLAFARRRVANAEATDVYLSAIPRLVVELGLILGALGFFAAQFFSGQGADDLGTFSIFLMASLRMMSSLLPLQRAVQAIRYFNLQAVSAQKFLAKVASSTAINLPPPTVSDNPVRPPKPAGESSAAIEIRLRAVSFHYPGPKEQNAVLRNISFDIPRGGRTAIIGPSGAGKSTLVDIILGLHLPSSGHVECNGLTPEKFRRENPGAVSYVPQKPGLVSGSLEENVAIGVPRNQIDQKALWRALEVSSLSEFVSSLPNGPKTEIGAHADGLSGGQIQRLGLARALYSRPGLIVLDEATSALDADTEAAITNSMAALSTDTTIITVAHRLSTVKTADIVHVLDEGRIVASDSFASLKKNNSLVRRYVDLMSLEG